MSDLNASREAKLAELKEAQDKLRELQDELAVINARISNNEPLSEADKSFVKNLGWLATLSATIAAIAASL